MTRYVSLPSGPLPEWTYRMSLRLTDDFPKPSFDDWIAEAGRRMAAVQGALVSEGVRVLGALAAPEGLLTPTHHADLRHRWPDPFDAAPLLAAAQRLALFADRQLEGLGAAGTRARLCAVAVLLGAIPGGPAGYEPSEVAADLAADPYVPPRAREVLAAWQRITPPGGPAWGW